MTSTARSLKRRIDIRLAAFEYLLLTSFLFFLLYLEEDMAQALRILAVGLQKALWREKRKKGKTSSGNFKSIVYV